MRREAGRWLRRLAEVGAESEREAETATVEEELKRLRYGPRSSWPNPQVVFRRAKQAMRKRA